MMTPSVSATNAPTPIVALDVPTMTSARALVDRLEGTADFFKVGLQLYTAEGPRVVEWLRGTTLTDYQRRLDPALWDVFLARYRERLLPRLPDRRPFFFTFQRILIWGQL